MKALRRNVLLRSVGTLDVDRLVDMDDQLTGRAWRQWYERKTRDVVGEVHVSIGAELDGRLVGAMLGTLRNGDFGVPEPVAVLDTILVDRACHGMGIATAMLERLAENLRDLGVRRLRTELSWGERQWNGFLSRRGFRPMRWVSLRPSSGGVGPWERKQSIYCPPSSAPGSARSLSSAGPGRGLRRAEPSDAPPPLAL